MRSGNNVDKHRFGRVGLRVGSFTLAAWCGLAACSDDSPVLPSFSVGMVAKWNMEPRSPAEVGVVYTMVVSQYHQEETCQKISPETEVWANGIQLPFVPNPNAPGCSLATAVMGPYLEDRDLTVQIRETSIVVAQAIFTNLNPGTAATLVTPSDVLHTGDPLLIRPVPELPGDYGRFTFYPLNSDPWQPFGISTEYERKLDGIHLTVPAFTGPAILVSRSAPVYVVPHVRCSGFAVCKGEGSSAIGPFFVQGAP